MLHLDTVLLPANQIGLRLFGTGTSLSTANVNGTQVVSDANAFDGLVMNGGTVNLNNSEFNTNGGFGAPNVGVSLTAGDLTLSDSQVMGNKKEGVLVKSAAPVTLKLDTVTLSSNGNAGLSVNEGTGALSSVPSTTVKVIDSEVTGNSTDMNLAAASRAGIIFFLPLTLQEFSGTHVHNNKGDQIRVNTGLLGGSVTIQGNSCDAQVYCYDTAGGGVGVSQTGGVGGSVQVKDITFSHTHLVSGVDYSGSVSQSGGTCTTPSTLVCP